MKKYVKLISLFCSLLILFTCAACGKNEGKSGSVSENLDWLNTDGSLPIVKKGTTKTLKVAIRMYNDSGDADTQWLYQFVKKEMNINLEVTKLSSGASEQLMLLFASGELPDIIIGGGVSTNSLVKYGNEGIIADLAPYITEKLTPNLYKIYSEHPEYKNTVADSEGHIWSLGYINDTKDRGQISRAFYNYDWLEDSNLKTPSTLDEFLTAMRTFKKRGSDIVPMGGSWASENPLLIVLNSFGYITEDSKGCSIALRNGKYVLPVADREVYGEYLKVLRQIYSEGLIDENFFTMTAAQVRSKIAGGKNGYISAAPFGYVTNFTSWWGAAPLTSSYNKSAQWPQGSAARTMGGFLLSNESKNKELAMAFADWFFGEDGVNYNLSTNGPAKTQKDYIYDDKVSGFEIDKDSFTIVFPSYENNTRSYSSKNDYLGKEVYLWGSRILGLGKSSVTDNLDALQYGYKPEEIKNTYPDVSAPGVQAELRHRTSVSGEMNFRAALEDTLVPYVTDSYIDKAYLEEAVSERIANLFTIVNEYATQETAKFVTGRRSLSELNDYFDQIEKLGATEIVKAYSDYFDKSSK